MYYLQIKITKHRVIFCCLSCLSQNYLSQFCSRSNSDFAGKPLQMISTRKIHGYKSFSLPSFRRFSYLAHFYSSTSSHTSSNRIVDSIKTIFLTPSQTTKLQLVSGLHGRSGWLQPIPPRSLLCPMDRSHVIDYYLFLFFSQVIQI